MATKPPFPTASDKAPGRGRVIATAAVVLAALAILLSLGTWQVERLHWKEGLLADIAERRAAAPVALSDIEAIRKSGGDIEYRRVSVTGKFDHARERHFFATFNGQTGFYVYTPMTLADGRVLFVNRGFVPYEMKDPKTRAAGEAVGQQTVTGYARVRLGEKPSSIVPNNDAAKNIFYWKDLDAMASTTGIDPAGVVQFFVDADASVVNPGGWPKGGVTQFDLPNSHLQYAVTWYGLAAALIAVVIGMIFRRKRVWPAG
ncbi:surfeit locus 1 family protein [Neorhizobium galegae]|uniref:SURF1 family protein n=1 Tax=Neorhizobium galegae TaxID=399 RepID=UPI002783AF02|nr:SURF1 family protein [Neorhizobium galegae]MDQ0133075.1 surfeit locus 1 family protein [Neorhizobium galegae]